ncbi:hypothetical protein Q664_17895 [Archangium violaceum Cb vi76]|uniref:Uncharacterized protein n=1 Tax=Archangium violaceum Cb vi76 TaxID=1406225 RepID=A0A084SUN2_9BACT|nr:hypothetical protein Q664_17895 [Archangium violaceum Cb vi76]
MALRGARARSVCAPCFAMEKLHIRERLMPSFATHPTMGTVTRGLAPAARLLAMKASTSPPGSVLEYARLSKYQPHEPPRTYPTRIPLLSLSHPPVPPSWATPMVRR